MNAIKTTEVVFYDDNFNKFSERDYAKADPRKKHDFEMLVQALAMIRRVLRDPRVCGLSVCRTLYDLVSGAMRYQHGAQEGIYDEHGNPRVAIVRKITEMNSALYDHVLNPQCDDDLAESETMLLARIALSRQPA